MRRRKTNADHIESIYSLSVNSSRLIIDEDLQYWLVSICDRCFWSFLFLAFDHGDINKKMVCRRSMIARISFVVSSQTGCYDRTPIVCVCVCLFVVFSSSFSLLFIVVSIVLVFLTLLEWFCSCSLS